MWKNYLTIIYRNIVRQKLNTTINLLGLAAGISAASLIFLFVHTEISYDEQWKNPDDLYRVNQVLDYKQKESNAYAVSAHFMGRRLQDTLPELTVCITEYGDYGHNIFVEDKWLDPGVIRHATDNFFEVFTYPRNHFSVQKDTLPKAWISEEVYERHFSRYNTRTFTYGSRQYQLAGTFSKQGYFSHFSADVVLPYDSSMLKTENRNRDWTRLNSNVFIRSSVKQTVLEKQIQSALSQEVDAFIEKNNLQMKIRFPLIPISAIHFSQQYQYDSYSNGDKNIVWLFSIIGILILTIASINYINMAIAQGGIRAREIAIRKTVGASRRNIIFQFMGESIAITLIAIIVSVMISEMLFPAFNKITGFDFHLLNDVVLGKLAVFLLLVWIVLGFLSGFYPAFVLSLFQPITIFRGGADVLLYRNVKSYFVSSTKVRKLMLVAQYVVAGTIIIATIIIQLQTHFLLNRDLGFDLNNLVMVELEKDSSRNQQYEKLLNNVLELERVQKATLADRVPGQRTARLLFTFDSDSGQYQNDYNFFDGKPNYLEVLGCDIVSGRWFDPDGSRENLKKEVLVNQAFVEALKWKSPLGKTFASGYIDKHKVVGIVNNFNYYSLHQKVQPLVILPDLFDNSYLIMNVKQPDKLLKSGKIEHLWNGFFPNEVPAINLLRQSFNSQYAKENRLLRIFVYFSGLSIVISSLGLFALSAFSAQKRSKEISIRKILGAGPRHIIKLLYTDYMQIFALATFLAWFTSYMFAAQWLDTFVKAVSPGVLPYFLGTMLILGVVIVTVSYHALKTLRVNPSVFLKYE